MANQKPVTVAITRQVRADSVEPFEKSVCEWIPKAINFPGYLGALILQPTNEGDEYGVMLHFSSEAAWVAFQQWPDYVAWLASLHPFLKAAPKVQRLNGLEGWFSGDEKHLPPRWKMAIVTWVGVNLTTYMMILILNPMVASWPFLLQFLTFNAAVVAGLTWVVMPVLTRLSKSWL